MSASFTDSLSEAIQTRTFLVFFLYCCLPNPLQTRSLVPPAQAGSQYLDTTCAAKFLIPCEVLKNKDVPDEI